MEWFVIWVELGHHVFVTDHHNLDEPAMKSVSHWAVAKFAPPAQATHRRQDAASCESLKRLYRVDGRSELSLPAPAPLAVVGIFCITPAYIFGRRPRRDTAPACLRRREDGSFPRQMISLCSER
jgi:hypothetical protein